MAARLDGRELRAKHPFLTTPAALCGSLIAVTADSLPPIPSLLFGVNQYSVPSHP